MTKAVVSTFTSAVVDEEGRGKGREQEIAVPSTPAPATHRPPHTLHFSPQPISIYPPPFTQYILARSSPLSGKTKQERKRKNEKEKVLEPESELDIESNLR